MLDCKRRVLAPENLPKTIRRLPYLLSNVDHDFRQSH